MLWLGDALVVLLTKVSHAAPNCNLILISFAAPWAHLAQNELNPPSFPFARREMTNSLRATLLGKPWQGALVGSLLLGGSGLCRRVGWICFCPCRALGLHPALLQHPGGDVQRGRLFSTHKLPLLLPVEWKVHWECWY